MKHSDPLETLGVEANGRKGAWEISDFKLPHSPIPPFPHSINSHAQMPGILVMLALLFLGSGCVIRPLDPETGKAIIEETQQSFNATSFVKENWDARIMPAVQDNAVELITLLEELGQDPEAASMKYGYREGSRPYNFKVKGTGRVMGVDTTSRAGTLTLKLAEDAPDVVLQFGPVIRGTALRDALSFITFDQFVNQLEYARVSNAMNAHLVESVLSGINHDGLLNQEISFSGVFSLRDIDSIMITPVDIQVR